MIATTLRLPEQQLKALRVISSLENKPMSRIIQDLVEDFLEEYFDLQDAKKALEEEGEIPWEKIKSKLNLGER